MPCLTTYTQKYVNASPQMNGLDSTFWNRFCKSESSSSFVSVVVVSVVSRSVFFESAGSSARSSGDSTGSKPLVSGVVAQRQNDGRAEHERDQAGRPQPPRPAERARGGSR